MRGSGGWLICSGLCSCAGASDAAADSSAAAAVTIPPRQWRGWRPACGAVMRLYTLQAVGARCDWQSLAGWHLIFIKTRWQCSSTVWVTVQLFVKAECGNAGSGWCR